jgi:hypothetical protein
MVGFDPNQRMARERCAERRDTESEQDAAAKAHEP